MLHTRFASSRLVIVSALALGLAGCAGGSVPGLDLFGSSSTPPAPAETQTATAGSATTGSEPATRLIIDFDPANECPAVNVPSGASAFSSGQGQTIRYQASLLDFARECTMSGPQSVAIKIGVRGLVKLGEAGSPGSYTAPLRITVRTRAGEVVSTITQRVKVTIPPGAQNAPFQYVAAPVTVPISLSQPLRSYDLQVGFDSRG